VTIVRFVTIVALLSEVVNFWRKASTVS